MERPLAGRRGLARFTDGLGELPGAGPGPGQGLGSSSPAASSPQSLAGHGQPTCLLEQLPAGELV